MFQVFVFFCILTCCLPSHSMSICMATLYQASCCCPFLSSHWILITTFKGKHLQSSFIKCSHWEEASRCPALTYAAALLFCKPAAFPFSNLIFQVWRKKQHMEEEGKNQLVGICSWIFFIMENYKIWNVNLPLKCFE